MPATKPNVVALVAQMPDTDKEIQAKQEEAKREAQPGAADKPKPRPDRWGAASKFTGPGPAEAEKVFAEILSGGRDSIIELLGLVREPGDPDYKDYKPGYVLHGLVIYVGRAGKEAQRRLLAETLASQLDNDKHSKAVKGFLIRELRLIGGPDVVAALGRHLLDHDLCEDATQALLTIRGDVAPQLRSALEKSKGRSRLTLIQALGVLRDQASASALKNALADADPDLRRTAAWALANLGEASAANAVIDYADNAKSWERIEANKACLLLAERLVADGQKTQAARVYAYLRDTRTDPTERHIREAAERSLSAPAR